MLLGITMATAIMGADPPHVLFFLSDDLGWSNIGFHNPAVHTPNLDRLRQKGLELTRHYAYKFCSPSRSSLLSGRWPIHVNERNKITEAPLAGIPPGMTILPEKLKEANYVSHHIGKWHCGMGSRSLNIPIARGFNTSLGYFHGAEDHYDQRVSGNVECEGAPFADLWLNDGPAYGLNGTNYSLLLYHHRALDIVTTHDLSRPLFLYLAYDNNHAPLQVPEAFVHPFYPRVGHAEEWLKYQGMITAVDWSVGKIVERVLERPGMWENTLVIWTSDNGGPEYVGGGANNFPLRGGKVSDFEGGVRVPAIVSGGYLPEHRHNSTFDGTTLFADWYTTLVTLAGLDPTDHKASAAGLPQVDGRDMMPAIEGRAEDPKDWPWAGQPIMLVSYASDPIINNGITSAVLIYDEMKLIVGTARCAAWSGAISPNKSHPIGTCPRLLPDLDCGDGGCLFDVVADPSEHVDLASDPAHATTLTKLHAMMHILNGTVYNPDRGDPGQAPCEAARQYGGFWAPYLP